MKYLLVLGAVGAVMIGAARADPTYTPSTGSRAPANKPVKDNTTKTNATDAKPATAGPVNPVRPDRDALSAYAPFGYYRPVLTLMPSSAPVMYPVYGARLGDVGMVYAVDRTGKSFVIARSQVMYRSPVDGSVWVKTAPAVVIGSWVDRGGMYAPVRWPVVGVVSFTIP